MSKTMTDLFPTSNDDQSDLVEEIKFYKAKWTCSNCGTANEDEIERGTRMDQVDLECTHCGCY